MTSTIGGWLQKSAHALDAVSDSARIDAEILLGHQLKKPRSFFYTWPEKTLDAEASKALQGLLARRLKGEPVAFIVGEWEFWSLKLWVSPSTLIPRGDTEVLVSSALEQLPRSNQRVLDLGTGTGAIAIALATERPQWQLEAVDREPSAVALAQRNVQRYDLQNLCAYQSHWFDQVDGVFHGIVSNPPYIDPSDPHLQRGDLRFEPHSALVADDDGLADIRYIVEHSRDYLVAGGLLAIEHGWQQQLMVTEIFHNFGFKSVACEQDLAGHDRVSWARRS